MKLLLAIAFIFALSGCSQEKVLPLDAPAYQDMLKNNNGAESFPEGTYIKVLQDNSHITTDKNGSYHFVTQIDTISMLVPSKYILTK